MKSKWKCFPYILLVVSALTSCGFLFPDNPEQWILNSSITLDTTLEKGTYTAADNINIDAHLIIPPGTVIKMDRDVWISVETQSGAGRITAIGTADEPIIFTSSSASPSLGDWMGLFIENNGSDFQFCEFRFAKTAIEVNGNNVNIDNCIFQSNGTALSALGTTSGFSLSNSQFINNTKPLMFNNSFDIDNTNTYTGNAQQMIEFYDNSIVTSRVWKETKVPIFCNSSIYVNAPLTLMPGVRLSMGADVWIEVISTSGTGKITAVGTDALPIRFTSVAVSPAAGDWYGLEIDNNGSEFEYCEFSYAQTAIKTYTDQIIIENSSFLHNTQHFDAHETGYALSGTNSTD